MRGEHNGVVLLVFYADPAATCWTSQIKDFSLLEHVNTFGNTWSLLGMVPSMVPLICSYLVCT